MRIERITESSIVQRGAHLFDDPLSDRATERFLSSADHHLLFAFTEGEGPVGMISGVETTHPDKGTEMFLYELGVDEAWRRQGIATALVHALEMLARDRGCYGMWVPVDADNEAALATYRRAAAQDEESVVVFTWEFGTGG